MFTPPQTSPRAKPHTPALHPDRDLLESTRGTTCTYPFFLSKRRLFPPRQTPPPYIHHKPDTPQTKSQCCTSHHHSTPAQLPQTHPRPSARRKHGPIVIDPACDSRVDRQGGYGDGGADAVCFSVADGVEIGGLLAFGVRGVCGEESMRAEGGRGSGGD